MFRKCTSFLLAALILVSNVGLAFNVHFCEGQLASISSAYATAEIVDVPAAPAEKSCCAKPDADHKSCCKDKTVSLKDKSDNTIIKTISFGISAPFVAVHEVYSNFFVAEISAEKLVLQYFSSTHSPPLFKLYNQYIFYA